jgi:arginine utilization protein RocB
VEAEKQEEVDTVNLRQKAEQLTLDLVRHGSVVGSPGEAKIAHYIYDLLAKLPYFQQHPNQLMLQPTEQDDHLRYNVIALVKGEQRESKEALLLLGHMDTVGVDDYHQLKTQAFSPDSLKEQLKSMSFPESIAKEVHSENWLFGRGILDMKSGVAAHLLAIEAAAEKPKDFTGNLFFLAECDEEDNSRGVLTALPQIEKLCKEHGLHLEGAINADYTAPRYPGDDNRYLYYGTVGKQLPAFYIVGKETHVGDPFGGLDPNYLAAAILEELSYNPEYCDIALGEVATPPISLKLHDFKRFYTVQTNVSTLVYFNLAVHHWSPDLILQKMAQAADKACQYALNRLQERYDLYCKLSNLPKQALPWQIRVLTYKEMIVKAKATHGIAFEEALQEKAEALLKEELDLREYNTAMVEFVWQYQPDKRPAVVLFFGSMYYPRIQLDRENAKDARLIKAVENAVQANETLLKPYDLSTRFFFPYIADSSFLSLSDDAAALSTYTENYPAHLKRQRTDFDLIGRISMPVVNIGSYGKDAHQFLERIDADYTLGVVPVLIWDTIQHFFKK